mmetsp:Transcript_13763/g.35733  ORF Transcript_13763/g.35733 Transcript_13763/m.35733 type:complete len:80 (+) Transcript_13763:140-379(+)
MHFVLPPASPCHLVLLHLAACVHHLTLALLVLRVHRVVLTECATILSLEMVVASAILTTMARIVLHAAVVDTDSVQMDL